VLHTKQHFENVPWTKKTLNFNHYGSTRKAVNGAVSVHVDSLDITRAHRELIVLLSVLPHEEIGNSGCVESYYRNHITSVYLDSGGASTNNPFVDTL